MPYKLLVLDHKTESSVEEEVVEADLAVEEVLGAQGALVEAHLDLLHTVHLATEILHMATVDTDMVVVLSS